MGVGWSFTFGDRLHPIPARSSGDDAGGNDYEFTEQTRSVGNSTVITGYVTPDGIHGSFTHPTSSSYQFVSSTGMTYSFDFQGTEFKLDKITDRNGNYLSISPAAVGPNSTQSVYSNGGTAPLVTYIRNANGEVSSVMDDTGRTWSFTYVVDPEQFQNATEYQLASVTNPAGGVTSYVYNPNNYKLATTVDADGAATNYAYDASGRCTTVTDALGVVQSFSYDATDLDTVSTDGRGFATTYHYDAESEPVEIDYPDGSNEKQIWANGELLEKTDALGHTTSYGYDLSGDVTQTIDADGIDTFSTFNSFGEPLTVSQNYDMRTTSYSYDADGNCTQIVDPLGNVTSMTYQSNGLELSETRPLGNVSGSDGLYTTMYGYNASGQVTLASSPLGAPTPTSAWAYAYDARAI